MESVSGVNGRLSGVSAPRRLDDALRVTLQAYLYQKFVSDCAMRPAHTFLIKVIQYCVSIWANEA